MKEKTAFAIISTIVIGNCEKSMRIICAKAKAKYNQKFC
jgi:hypothetical protein